MIWIYCEYGNRNLWQGQGNVMIKNGHSQPSDFVDLYLQAECTPEWHDAKEMKRIYLFIYVFYWFLKVFVIITLLFSDLFMVLVFIVHVDDSVSSSHRAGWHCRRPWPNLSHFPGIRLKVLRKTIKILTRIISVPAENRTELFPNRSQKNRAVAFESDSTTPDSTSDIANILAAWCNGGLGLRGGGAHLPAACAGTSLAGRGR